MNFKETSEFRKEFKRFQNKYLSLSEDLEELKKVLREFPLGAGKHFNVLAAQKGVRIVKARLFCRYLRGSSLRIIYAYHEKTKEIKFIEFIELYFKGEKEREDKNRIQDYLKVIE